VFTLQELATELGLAFTGDGRQVIGGLAPLQSATGSDITFLAGKKHLAQLESTQAAAVILHPDFQTQCAVACLLSDTPYVSFARVSQLYQLSPGISQGIHPTATVSPDADVHASASIGPHACVEGGASVAENAVVGANVYLGHDSRLGANSRLFPGVVVYHNVHIGENCSVHGQTVLGADGFGFAPGPQGWEKIAHLGGLRIGNRVDIGASTTIDRGALEHTIIEDGVIIDNQVHIAHNCRIGKNTAIAGCAGIAGSTIIGANCTFAGGVGSAGQLEICDDVHVTGMSMITKSITEPGYYSSGIPAAKTRDWRRNAVRLSQLDSIYQRLVKLEKSSSHH
jgi:UDP-3-O-[3-hydroxymyristoyl] glucosamine N-acyltransferase